MRTRRCAVFAAVVAAALWSQARTARAAANLLDQLKLADHVQSLKFGGDLRIRDEYFDRRSAGRTERHRQRFRLRVGAEMALPYDLMTRLRLASGTGEQVSTNQSYDNLSAQKGIFIDQIFLRWSPKVSDNGSFYVATGRMENFLWRQYSSDLVWDDDFNPEGFSEGVEWLCPMLGVTVFANALQMVADEDGSSSGGSTGDSDNQWVLSEQAGVEARLPFESRLRLGMAYHKWSNERNSDFAQSVANQGNRRVGATNALANNFGIGEVTGQLSTWAGQLPIAFQATLARNFRARGDLAGPRASDGYQVGVVIGKAKAENSWEFAAFKKYAQTDATVADVSDSDFGDGGTNRQGGIFWLAYNPAEWLQAKAKYFTTKVIDTQFAPGANDVNRLQLDMSLKF